MPCKGGNGTNEAHLPRRKKQAENGARNAQCQGHRGATRKAAKHARRRRLRQALLSPGMGLRAHACMELDKTKGRRGHLRPMGPAQTSDAHGDETRSFNCRLRAGTCQDTPKTLESRASHCRCRHRPGCLSMGCGRPDVTTWSSLAQAYPERTPQHEAGRCPPKERE